MFNRSKSHSYSGQIRPTFGAIGISFSLLIISIGQWHFAHCGIVSLIYLVVLISERMIERVSVRKIEHYLTFNSDLLETIKRKTLKLKMYPCI